jgi:response regulator RpfG family c-di-GMP phosphodiesterase
VRTWAAAAREIQAQAGGQFDPAVVEAFSSRDRALRRIRRQLTAQPPLRSAVAAS